MDINALRAMLGGSGGGGGGGAAAAAAALGRSAGMGSGGPRPAPSPAELRTTADSMWQMLDDLAASDPDGYKRFIANQMKEMEAEKARQAETEAMFTPTPAFAIATRQTSGKGAPRTVYINVCTSPQVPALQTKQRTPAKGDEPLSDVLIPLSVGAFKQQVDAQEGGGKEVTTSDVVFHPSVVARAQGPAEMAFKMFMLELALQHLEEDEKVVLHRAYKLLSQKYVGQTGESGRPLTQQRTESELARAQFVDKMKKEREEALKSMQTKNKEVVMPSRVKQEQARKQFEEEVGIKELKLRPGETSAGGAAQAGAAGAGTAGKKKVLIEDLTPDQGEDESLRAPAAASAAAAAAASQATAAKPASSSSSSSSAKPALSLASSKKLTASSSASADASTAAPSGSALPDSTSGASGSQSDGAGAWSSRRSAAISADELMASLAAVPATSEPQSSWPYGSSGASMRSTESLMMAAREESRTAPVQTSSGAAAAAPASSGAASSGKSVPSHTMSVNGGALELSIALPLVDSVAAVTLDVSATALRLESEHYTLTLTFPAPIDDTSSAAKFIKKQRTLKITAKFA